MEISIAESITSPRNCKCYNVTFDGFTVYTTVTDRPDAADDWIGELKSRQSPNSPGLIVGFDVEYNRASAFIPKGVAVLQLCVNNFCLVYQILHSDGFVPPLLTNFLSGKDEVIFVGVDIGMQLERLYADYGIGRGAVYVDLPEAAAEVCDNDDLADGGLRELVKEVLERDVEKPIEVVTELLCRWNQRVLSERQVMYACVDAYMCYEIGMCLGIDSAFG